MRLRRLILVACAVAAALAVAGCGAFKNTIKPQPGTTTHITLELAGKPNGLMAGLYDAIALGYYKQADTHVYVSVPHDGQDPLAMLHDFQTEVAVSSAPDVLLRRDQSVPVVSVGAIVQVPLSSVKVRVPVKKRRCTRRKSTGRRRAGSGKRVCKTVTVMTTEPTSTVAGATVDTEGGDGTGNLAVPKDAAKLLAGSDVPTYQGLVFVVRPASIVNAAPAIRLFLQTTARGYEAARRNPEQAIANMIKVDPSLASKRTLLLAQLRAFLPHMFPSIPTSGSGKGKPQPWGFQSDSLWNTFGYWLHDHNLIGNPNAVINASDNELLAGKGV